MVSSLIRNISSTAGLRLRDHAKVGLCQVPGRRGAGGRAVSGTVGGRGTGFVLPAWPFLQRCHHAGMTRNKLHKLAPFYRVYETYFNGPLKSFSMNLSRLRCCPFWHWGSVWTTCSYWLTPSPRLEVISPLRYLGDVSPFLPSPLHSTALLSPK